MQNNNFINNDCFTLTPVIIFNNVEVDKLRILTEIKGKAGIYLWTHLESGNKYVGSAVDLSKRLNYYYSPLALKRADNYISRAIICHTHSAFSLSIIEYIDISNLDKKEAKTLILEREQHYIDFLKPEYNLNPIAVSRLGSKRTEESKALISGKNNPMNGRTHSTEVLLKISEINGTAICLYDTHGSLVNTFTSSRKAGKHLDVCHKTILKYTKSGKIFKEQ